MSFTTMQNPSWAEALLKELHETAMDAQATTGPPEEIRQYTRTRMFDTTIALLIRHRIPIEADATLRMVRAAEKASNAEPLAWARACALHVTGIARRHNH